MVDDIRQGQISFLQKIKSLFMSEPPREDQKPVENSVPETGKIQELMKRMEKIEQFFGKVLPEGPRKVKVKEQIIGLLQQNKKLNSNELSSLIGLSRTRCSEYLRELTKEGKTEGIIVNRKKYYKIVG